MLPSVADVIRLPEMARGEPQVVGGAGGLGNGVRWVHVSELADIAHLLSGGELLLTTGIALPDDRQQMKRYVESLHRVALSGLVIELGRKFKFLPRELTEAADEHELPLVVLHREVQFVKITEAAHGLIINSQIEELRRQAEIHQSFTEMTLEGASTTDVIRLAARLLRAPVVLENLRHQVIGYEPAGADVESLLADWETKSRRAPRHGRGEVVAGNPGWLIAAVGARGEVWARLVLVEESPPPTEFARAVLERAASAIALNRLIERDRESLIRQSQGSLLNDIMSGAYRSESEVQLRAQALGVQLGRHLIGCAVRIQGPPEADALRREARRRDRLERVARAIREARVPCVMGRLPSGLIGILVSGARGADDRHLERLAFAIRDAVAHGSGDRVIVGAGSVVSSLPDVRRTFLEAEQVVAAAQGEGEKPYYRLTDVRLPGLLQLLQGDSRFQAFIERELGELFKPGSPGGSVLISTLETYLRSGRNTAETARNLRISRPTLYRRLREIRARLGVDLTVESCLSLHVALIGARLSSGDQSPDTAAETAP